MKPLIPPKISFIIGIALVFLFVYFTETPFIWCAFYIPPVLLIVSSDALALFLSKTERRQSIVGIDTIYPDFIRVASATWILSGHVLNIRYFSLAPTTSSNYTLVLDDISNCMPISVCLIVLLDVAEGLGMIIRNALVTYYLDRQQRQKVKRETRDAIRESKSEQRGMNKARLWYEKKSDFEARGLPFDEPPPWDE